MNPTRSPDDPRDPHLLAALHNAPDRDAAPAALLSAAILAQARQAVRGAPAAAPSRWGAWQAAFDRLWQPAPMAAFGTLAMAAVIGVMWQGQEVPDPTPGLRPQPSVTLPTPVASAPAVALDTARATHSSPRQDGDASAKAVPTPSPPARVRRDPPMSAQVQPRAAPPTETQPAPRAERSVGPTPWPAQARETPSAEAARAAPLAPPLPARAGAAAAQTEPAAASADTGDERRGALGKSLGDATRPPSRSAAQARPGHMTDAAAPTPVDPLAPASAALQAATGRDPSLVQWRLTPQRVVAHDVERRAWWAALQRATEGRWQAAAPGSASAALSLLIDGAPGGSIAFEPQAVLWSDARGRVWRAPLSGVDLRVLQDPLARW